MHQVLRPVPITLPHPCSADHTSEGVTREQTQHISHYTSVALAPLSASPQSQRGLCGGQHPPTAIPVLPVCWGPISLHAAACCLQQLGVRCSCLMLCVTQVDLLRISTHGHDPEVLDGARDLLNRRIPVAVIFDFHTGHWEGHSLRETTK